MGLFGTAFAYRRALVELRGLRNAAERIAAVLELQAGSAPRPGAQSFRGFSHDTDRSDGKGSGVSYVDPQEMQLAFEKEGELVALLGRKPTSEELERAMVGDVE
jgi:hypothetical protein